MRRLNFFCCFCHWQTVKYWKKVPFIPVPISRYWVTGQMWMYQTQPTCLFPSKSNSPGQVFKYGTSQKVCATHHTVYLWLAPLCQVYDVDSVVVEVLHAAVEVLPQKGARFTRQWDASEAQLRWRENRGVKHLATRCRNPLSTAA